MMENKIASISSLQSWFLAARPRTLSISFAPILVATLFAASEGIEVNFLLFLSAFLVSLVIQIGTNLVNDALDFKKGTDRKDRLGPMRVTQNGLLSYSQVMRVGICCFLLAFVVGLPLILKGGLPLVYIISLCILCGYLYTGGPYPLAYLGISDFFVFFFYGWVATATVYYLQTGDLNILIFLPATQLGLLANVPHAINNLRDHVSDRVTNKKTVAVRFGATFARILITFCSLFPLLLGFVWYTEGYLWSALLPLLSLIPIGFNLSAIWRNEPNEKFNLYLAKSAQCQLLFALILSLSFFMRG